MHHDPTSDTFIVHTLTSEGADASEDGTGRGLPLVLGTLAASYGKQAGRDFEVSDNLIVARRRVRRITPIEAERLQGFPDHWTKHDSNGRKLSDASRYRMIGNAVAVPVAKWIGSRLIQAVEDSQ